uniref:Spindle assembly abnormal protein 6 N-terminal domain-containing protein n=1 Tax=Ditylenchus dipsaci TaxID=166011 RepID=A0A915DE66_9BILA
MSKEKLFDEEIRACINTSSSDSLCSATTISRKIMLRITTNSGFEVEIYDEQNVDFLYSGAFSHSRFKDLRQRQHFTFSIDQAPQKIISFVRDSRQNNMKYIKCTLLGNTDKNQRFCKLELVTRSDFKDMCMMSLELNKLHGDQLNAHLIQFIQKYKQQCEEIPVLKKQFENIQIVRTQENVRRTETPQKGSAAMMEELHEENDELMGEVRKKAAEAKHAYEQAETQEANLRSLRAYYKTQLVELEKLTEDNEKFAQDLDQCDSECEELQEQLKKSLQQKKKLHRLYKSVDAQLRSCKASSEHYKKRLATSENRCQLLEEEFQRSLESLHTQSRELNEFKRENDVLKIEKTQISIEMEGLKTHSDLLTTQMNEMKQKKSIQIKGSTV